MNTMILERADHLQAGAVADVSEARIFVAAEMSLQDTAVFRPIEDRTPRFQFAHAIRRFFGVKLSHAPLIHVLPAAHRIGEMHLPVVALVHIRERRGDPALGHDGVRFAKQRFADQPDAHARRGSFNRGAQARTAGADD